MDFPSTSRENVYLPSTSTENVYLKRSKPPESPDELASVIVSREDKISCEITRVCESNGMGSDVTLVVGGKDYPAHRSILGLSSEVFQVMLLNNEWSEAQESRIILQESSQCANVFGKFLAFFYNGRVLITQECALPLLKLATKYFVTDLPGLCVDFMMKRIAFAARDNLLVSWLQHTLVCGPVNLSQACENFVKWNFKMIAETSDFFQIDSDVLVYLLQQNDLVVHDEMQLYNYVVTWLQGQRSRMHELEDIESAMTQLTHLVMSHVRFPMMTSRQLAELQLSPFIQNHKEFFVERMALGIAFHSGQQSLVRAAMLEEDGASLFTPRLYTADTWSAVLTVENYYFLEPYDVRTLNFSSLRSCAEFQCDKGYVWSVDFHPRGVRFEKGILVKWQGTDEVSEAVMRTVRVAVTCINPDNDYYVKVGVLVYGTSAGIEHIALVREKTRYLDCYDKVINFDNLLPFEESEKKQFFTGPNQDGLKIEIVIAPLFKIPKDDA